MTRFSMGTFSERLRTWRHMAGFTQPEMGALLGFRGQAEYYNYERRDTNGDGKLRGSIPSADRGLWFAQRMLVRFDWLFGDSDKMWDEDLLSPLRHAIRHEQPNIIVESDESKLREYMKREEQQAFVSGESKRVCALLRFTHKFDPERYDQLLLQALATKYFKGKDYMKEILEGEYVQIPDEGIRRLSEIWGVSLLWLRTGTELSFHNEIDANKWGLTVDTFEMDKLPPEFFADMRVEIGQLRDVWLHRKQRKTPS